MCVVASVIMIGGWALMLLVANFTTHTHALHLIDCVHGCWLPAGQVLMSDDLEKVAAAMYDNR
jgi:hypothetical protein